MNYQTLFLSRCTIFPQSTQTAARHSAFVDCDMARPERFGANAGSFCDVEIVDVRLSATAILGVRFRQADFMSPDSVNKLTGEPESGEIYCDSFFCLHV